MRIFEFYLPSGYYNFLSPSFKSTVNSLSPFNSSSQESVAKWIGFFATYGTHVVKSVFVGGFIESKLKFNGEVDQNTLESSGFKLLDDISLGIERNRSFGVNSSFVFHGGINLFGNSVDFNELRVSDAVIRLQRWKESLNFNPVVLQDGIKLVPISVAVNKLGSNISLEVHKAMTRLFNSDLKYVVPPRTTPKPRNEIQTIINQFKPEETTFWGKIWEFFKSLFG